MRTQLRGGIHTWQGDCFPPLAMKPNCPQCDLKSEGPTTRPRIKRDGYFYRRSDSRRVQRFRCLRCRKHFSFATHHPCYRQKKRQMNEPLRRFFCSGVSQRRLARNFSLSRTTVVRKLLFLAAQAELELEEMNQSHPPVEVMEFDDLETFEHTKCKPLSVTLAVESGSRRILGFEVSQMPAKGPLASIARKKYGPRKDLRQKGRAELFQRIQPHVNVKATIKSDENPHYTKPVKVHFPKAQHETFKGQRGCIVGQGELKKIGFDPLFSLNHTCAMLRANINRLFRKTWCTTKKARATSGSHYDLCRLS